MRVSPSSILKECESLIGGPRIWEEAQEMVMLRPEQPDDSRIFAYAGGLYDVMALLLAKKHNYQASKLHELNHRALQLITAAPVLLQWHFARGIYRFDDELAHELGQTVVEKIPTDVLKNLPEYAPFIELGGVELEVYQFESRNEKEYNLSKWKPFEVVGFWFNYEPQIEEDSPDAVCFSMLLKDGALQTLKLPLVDQDLNKCIESLIEGKKTAFMQDTTDEENLRADTKQRALRIIQIMLSRVLYLCSREPDISGVVKKPAKHRRKPLFLGAKRDNFITVGERFGGAVREWRAQERDDSEEVEASEPTGATVAPHIRRGHWHLYWVGKGRQTPEIKWIAPMAVGAKVEEMPVHRRNVEERTS